MKLRLSVTILTTGIFLALLTAAKAVPAETDAHAAPTISSTDTSQATREAALRRHIEKKLTRVQHAQQRAARKDNAAAVNQIRSETAQTVEQYLTNIRQADLSAVE